jgi:hypothetical protein
VSPYGFGGTRGVEGTLLDGCYREVVVADAGHSPHLERLAEFLAALTDVLAGG